VTCEKLSAGRTNLEVLKGLIEGGARVVQLREKEMDDGPFLALARRFRKMTSAAGMALVVNDRIDVAMTIGADGVHLGQDDFPVAEARKLLGNGVFIGVSTHSLEQALRASGDGADYINVGPIFPTATKDHAGHAVGADLLRRVRERVSIPITVMGGIKLDNLGQVLDAGARRIAVVTAVVGAPDIAAAVRAFRARIAAAGSTR
jgi:thiamine-phosphate pyrophosphorylase